MSASKFTLYGTSLFRIPRTLSTSPSLLFSKPFTLKPIRYSCSASTAVGTGTDDGTQTVFYSDRNPHHPWPEWVSFIDRLKTRGYLVESSASSSSSNEDKNRIEAVTGGVGDTAAAEIVYRNMNLVKHACLSFARDRYDVFKLLSVKDIQAVVEGGCPNLLRKAVNSAKRLRVHVGLDEGDVCSACILRGSCDKAYVILKEPEASARTVDIMRTLLFHALDPLVISGGEKPPGGEVIESSARKLLLQLIDLSESSPAPARPKSTEKNDVPKIQPLNLKTAKDVEMKRADWMCPKCNFMNFSRNMRCLNCKEDGPKSKSPADTEMRDGDWICPECNFMNFSRNMRCLNCKEDGPKITIPADTEMRDGDWICPDCSFMNFSRNMHCRKCKVERPEGVKPNEVVMKKGDWNCPRCGFMNFASNRKCKRCPEPRPMRLLNPGEWECPKCDFLNFRRNTVCLKCNTEGRTEQPTYDEDGNAWTRPN